MPAMLVGVFVIVICKSFGQVFYSAKKHNEGNNNKHK